MSESSELEPWQLRALQKMKSFNGKGVIQVTGRNTGKSYLSSGAFKRLFDDIYNRPVEELVLSEGTVYGSRYYCVEPVGGAWPEMEHWCHETFGNTGSIWNETKNLTPEPLQRWYANNRKFWFKDIKDRDWFILRWNS
jgi:hypothetical protein